MCNVSNWQKERILFILCGSFSCEGAQFRLHLPNIKSSNIVNCVRTRTFMQHLTFHFHSATYTHIHCLSLCVYVFFFCLLSLKWCFFLLICIYLSLQCMSIYASRGSKFTWKMNRTFTQHSSKVVYVTKCVWGWVCTHICVGINFVSVWVYHE